MSVLAPFQPTPGSSQSVTAGAAAELTNLRAADDTVVIANTHATDIAYVRICATGAATAADFPVLPGKYVCLRKGPNATRIGYYSAGTPGLIIATGTGWLST